MSTGREPRTPNREAQDITDADAPGGRAGEAFDGGHEATPSLPVTSTDADLLVLWRRRHADRLEGGQVQAMTRLLERVAVLFEPRWREAVAGDASVAVGVALRRRAPPSGGICLLDILMTCLLLSAHLGDPAADLVLTNTRDRYYP